MEEPQLHDYHEHHHEEHAEPELPSIPVRSTIVEEDAAVERGDGVAPQTEGQWFPIIMAIILGFLIIKALRNVGSGIKKKRELKEEQLSELARIRRRLAEATEEKKEDEAVSEVADQEVVRPKMSPEEAYDPTIERNTQVKAWEKRAPQPPSSRQSTFEEMMEVVRRKMTPEEAYDPSIDREKRLNALKQRHQQQQQQQEGEGKPLPSAPPKPASAASAPKAKPKPSSSSSPQRRTNPFSVGAVETLNRYPFLREWEAELQGAMRALMTQYQQQQQQDPSTSSSRELPRLSRILTNILVYPHEEKYRTFHSLKNQSFMELWKQPMYHNVLWKLGFKPQGAKATSRGSASLSMSSSLSSSMAAAAGGGGGGGGQVEEEDGKGEEGASEEGMIIHLPGVTEAHLEVIRKIAMDLDHHLEQVQQAEERKRYYQQQQQGGAAEAPAGAVVNPPPHGQWSGHEGDLMCHACGKMDLFIDRENARPEVLFKARHARVAIHCGTCGEASFVLCGGCYNMGTYQHPGGHQMVLLPPPEGWEAVMASGEGGGGWKKSAPVPSNKRPGRGPWG